MTDRSKFKTVQDWTLEAVQSIVTSNEDETDWFDFKVGIQPKTIGKEGKTDKRGLAKLACAFANSGGGYIIFGVENNKSLGLNRIVGINLVTGHTDRFGDQLIQIDPPLTPFAEKIIPVESSKGPDRGLWIVQIHRSDWGPHMLDGTYYKRLPAQAVPMRANEVRDWIVFDHAWESKMHALRFELESLARIAEYQSQSGGYTDREFDPQALRTLVVELNRSLPDDLVKSLYDLYPTIVAANKSFERLRIGYVMKKNLGQDPRNPDLLQSNKSYGREILKLTQECLVVLRSTISMGRVHRTE